MMFDKLVFKKNSKYYIDINNIDFDCPIYKGDNIKFIYDGKILYAKVINKIDNIYELSII
jgi:hypothetical protein